MGDSKMAFSREWKELKGGATFAASDEEVNKRIEEVAEELDQDPEEVAENVAFIAGDTDRDSGGINLAAGVGTESIKDNPLAEDDPRLEALNLYKERQSL